MSKQQDVFDHVRRSFIQTLYDKKLPVLIFPFIVGIITLVISLFLTPMFKSTAIVFPAATSTVSFSEQRNAKASSMDFGEEDQAEQLVQILKSSRIRNIIVDRFDLMNHYEIDADDENKYYKLGKAWENHIQFARTRYGSIQIDVWDSDRELAAVIANKIVDLIDTVKNDMVHERTIPAFEINKRKRDMLEKEKNELTAQLDSLSSKGVVPTEGRANLFQAYNDAKSPADKAFFKEQIDVNLQYGSTYDGLVMLRDERIVKLTKFEDAYEQAESDANTLFNHKFVVEPAVVADKKDKPKKAIIIILSYIGALVFIIFLILIRDRLAELKQVSLALKKSESLDGNA
jgi:uncharacterized protein involved in exopolysaccharide biosynthesis